MNKVIKVTVTTADGKEQGPTSTTVEVDRGAGYIRLDGRDLTTNSGKEEVFELAPGQRLVIEGWPAEEVIMDHAQSAAVYKSHAEAPKEPAPQYREPEPKKSVSTPAPKASAINPMKSSKDMK